MTWPQSSRRHPKEVRIRSPIHRDVRAELMPPNFRRSIGGLESGGGGFHCA
jgi:hypothetical protein